ncbi:FAD-dependent oxidoreductase domain-containing protein 1 isoform X2 [Fopius arisanus]|uniref:FAD-dependent oxidoreductase domain-containing protein 1 n=1 Tax=Fopius arisanus TaxID=64838 RepID=A0A9R1U9B7_9HYME|nr:PREDICTED: FAD-dependent oxidoreductase domain-containing protein 1 isoform X2 [Fopius arisanus]
MNTKNLALVIFVAHSVADDDRVSPRKTDGNYWETDVTPEHPVSRTARVMGKQMREIKQNVLFWREPKNVNLDEWNIDSTYYPSHVDVVIIGGGAMGSSIAYWLKKMSNGGLSVVVVEKDPTYSQASTVLSAGGLRQQFSLEENIEMSLYGAEFLRTIDQHLYVENEPPVDVQFHPYGYLLLASEEGAEALTRNSKLQNSKGAKNILLTAEKIKQRFPWMNTEGVALGCLGLENEGWFDPWCLLSAFKKKAVKLGAEYVNAEVKGFIFRKDEQVIVSGTGIEKYQGLNHVVVKTENDEKKVIQFALCVIAAGAHSGEIARLAKIGCGPGILTVPLPVECRKRYVYHFHAPEGPGINTPMTIDTSGTWFRREGLANHYICGRSPSCDADEPSTDNLDVDEAFFEKNIWPLLGNRVNSFENLKIESSWAGYYDYNKFDENGIIGPHPYFDNMYFACGFSGHGIQQAPAVGRAIAELVVYSEFRTLDLSRLAFDRLISLEPMQEVHII